jgi:hypothetical protein
MDQMSYKEKFVLLVKAGFTAAEMKRLCRFRSTYVKNEQDQVAPENLSHLYFIRWLVEHGRLTDQCVESPVATRGNTSHV